MIKAKAWAPGHATLFFAVPHKRDDFLSMGSLGGGINLASGVITEISEGKNNVYWNGKKIQGQVSKTVVEEFYKINNLGADLTINHYSKLKIGYGLSTSGAGAIGTALALNEFFNTKMRLTKLYQIAHIADAKNHTGLGSVMGQITSGIEIRTVQGGPGVGETIEFNDNSEIILLLLGQLRTSDVLVSDEQMQLITKTGMNSVNLMKSTDHITLDRIMEVGREFTRKCGLLTEKVKHHFEMLDELGESNYSMAMIGETIVLKPKNSKRVLNYAKGSDIPFIRTKITDKKPHIVKLSE